MTVKDRIAEEETKKARSSRRVNVDFSNDAYEVLTNIAQRKGQTVSGVLRDALALEKLYDDTVLKNGRILVEREDGSLREVIRP
jgi:hypothetical protein